MTTLTYAEWRARASVLAVRGEAFIDGMFQPAASGETFPSVNPATGAVLAKVAACDAAEVDRAVRAARAAYPRWAEAPGERKRALLRLANLIEEHGEELALLDSLDMGKRVVDAYTVDVPGAAAVFRFYAELIDKLYGEIAPVDGLALVSRVPLGVVGAVVPWNFPLDMAAWKLAPALAAGNTTVLKPAEQSPLSALRLAELAIEAGFPDGVLNVVPGYGETAGRALGLHPDVDCLTFTGSTEVGRFFQRYAGESNGKQVWLECGGKSAGVVFADAENLDAVADLVCFGFLANQGEVCSANTRLLVEQSIKDDLLERVIARARGMRPGDPLDPDSGMGALVDERHTARVLEHIDAGRRVADLVLGGERVVVDGSGCYVEPTVFGGVAPDSPLAQQEIFGPVLSVLGFDDEAEAIALANGTRYGLAASVFTGSLGRAHRVAAQLVAGTVSVNTVDALSPQTPFGGFKASGYGRDLSPHALHKYSGLKTTWIAC